MSTQLNSTQLTTFYIDSTLYGIEVMRVQEVTGTPRIVPVPLAPPFVLGLVNLRGQISLAIGIRSLLGYPELDNHDNMSVVCKIDGDLSSLLVDSIGEVVEVTSKSFEEAPETLDPRARKVLRGIYKLDGALLSELDLDKLAQEITRSNSIETRRNA